MTDRFHPSWRYAPLIQRRGLEAHAVQHTCRGIKHVDRQKLPPAAQEERLRQVIGLRRNGATYNVIAARVGLIRTGVFNICQHLRQTAGLG